MEMRPIRVIVFPERPEAMLVIAPEGESFEVVLPKLRAPFVKGDVAYTLGMAGISARVTEERPGRWTGAMLRAQREARAERGNQQKLREATTAALSMQSGDPRERDRGEVVRRKLEVDAEIADLKVKIGTAKANVRTRGVFMAPADFRRLEQRLEKAKVESQALQARLGELKREAKERAREHDKAWDARFVSVARKLLDPEDFADLCAAVDEEDEEDNAA